MRIYLDSETYEPRKDGYMYPVLDATKPICWTTYYEGQK